MGTGIVLSRVAEQIFWMSRYLERTIAVTRLVEVTAHLSLDAHERAEEVRAPDSGLSGTDNPDSPIACVRNARAAAREVRESISSEMWERLNTLYLLTVEPSSRPRADDNPYAWLKHVRDESQAVQGLADTTLVHGEEWHFFCLGMYLERATNVARALTLESHLLTLRNGPVREDETVRWLAVLRSCGSAEAYSRYYSMRVEPARVIEFLLLNALFPQSIRYSLNAAWLALRGIAVFESVDETNLALRSLGRLRASVEHTAVDEILESGLQIFLSDVQRHTWEVAEHVTRIYLRDVGIQDNPMPAARAAMIMAAQQQQQQQQQQQ